MLVAHVMRLNMIVRRCRRIIEFSVILNWIGNAQRMGNAGAKRNKNNRFQDKCA